MYSIEAPWHARQAAHELHLRHRRLLHVHRLTGAWTRELEHCPRELSAELQTLAALDQLDLEDWLDDTQPLDVVWRLERTVWSLHSHVLRTFLESSPASLADQVSATLATIAERLGFEAAETDWQKFVPGRAAGSNPVSRARRDLKRLILTLSGTPFANPVLVVRASTSEARIELLQCAHLSPFPEVRSLSDSLCAMHAAWIQGFARGLNPGIRIELEPGSGRCRQRWTLAAENET